MKTSITLLAATLLFPLAALAGPHPGEFHAKLAEVDTNGDGAMQIAEIEAASARRAAQIDGNGDGRIEAQEVRAWHEAMRSKRAEARLLKFDANGDGSVSVDEFGAAQVERLAKRDADGDGTLSGDELRSHRGHGMRHGRGRAKHAD